MRLNDCSSDVCPSDLLPHVTLAVVAWPRGPYHRQLSSGFVEGRYMVKVGIVGGTGYTGVELLRLLAQHPQAEVVVITSRSEAGLAVADKIGRASCRERVCQYV